MIALVLVALQPIGPSPLFTPTTAPISERAILEEEMQSAQARAKTLGATLGVRIVDLTTGATASSGGDVNLPMAGVQRLALAIVTMRAVDAGELALTQSLDGVTVRDLISRMVMDNDYASANALIQALGGGDAVNARLRALGFDAVFVAPDDAGYATPNALARLLSQLVNGGLLAPASTKLLLNEMKTMHLTHTQTSTNEAQILYINRRTVAIAAMLNAGSGSDEARDAVIAALVQAAADATAATP
ncbi:MAG TPA: serine hydrolase [Candidatus Baltobacteraceae bacterium]|nr:serine hydrolase [Candidatus Baltobacteraceae bacterium]